jgi:hypothetical protein
VSFLENKFINRVLFSLAVVIMGAIEMFFKTSTEFNFGYFYILAGGIIFACTIISYIKYQNNKKELDQELLKEYDERDELIDGKVSNFTLKIIIYVILLTMFLSNFIVIPTNTALFGVLLSFMVTELLSRKYYNHTI